MRERREVIKHSAAVHIQSNITLLQRRAWNVLLANAYDDLPTQDEYSVRIKELTRVLEFDSKKEDYLKEALRALTTCAVEWNVLGKDGDNEWGVTTLLAQAKIRNGICTYAYSPELRRRLHNPRMYARISLSMQNKFESKHAQALWEVCVDYLDETRNTGETPFLSLEVYRKLMGVSGHLYPEFKAFNRRVIKEPVEEINRVTDFHVEVVYQRKTRQIVATKFKVRRVPLLPGQITQQQQLFPDILDMAPAVKELKDAGLAAEEAWRSQPLESYEVVVALIGSTQTETGLEVHATLDEREYKKGIKVSDDDYNAINLKPHKFHGDWNYPITPRRTPSTR